MKPYYEHAGITIYHGDCRDILPHLPQVDLVLTDPPYGIERFKKGFGTTRFKGLGCEKSGIEWDIAPTEEEIGGVLAYGKEACVWGMNNLHLPTTEHFLVWDKEQTVDNFASAEIAWCNYKKPARVFRYAIHKHNHHKCGGHPTEKPTKLMEWCIGLADNPHTILDPFMGSGTTLVAAKELGRKAIGIEISKAYCDIAIQRLQQEVLPFSDVEKGVHKGQESSQFSMLGSMTDTTNSNEVS